MDISVANDPLELPEPTQSDSVQTTEGTVYGVAPQEPKEPPDLDLLFEGADLPGGRDNSLPFSLEWYAGAKERQRLRDEERERLDARRVQLRAGWTDLMDHDISDWIGRVNALASDDGSAAMGALSGLAELVARAAQESPDDAERNEQLVQAFARSEAEDDALNLELRATRGGLQTCKEAIQQAEARAVADDEAKAEAKRVHEARRAKAEEELRRQEALLRGEDPDAVSVPTARPDGSPLPPLPPAAAGRVASAEGAGRRLARSGPATELPPLQDPPRPGSNGPARGYPP
mmetsp:Transcript_36624/g.98123  ORF Transcript_36624/g.98123 Transcript_36624/m.98123 type:complete len:290 (+) Transcript_36624:106-975(+)